MQRDYRVRGFVIGRKLAVQRMTGETDYLPVACPQVLMSVATELSLRASIVLKILILIIMFLCMANYHSLLIPCSYYCLIWLHHYEVAE